MPVTRGKFQWQDLFSIQFCQALQNILLIKFRQIHCWIFDVGRDPIICSVHWSRLRCCLSRWRLLMCSCLVLMRQRRLTRQRGRLLHRRIRKVWILLILTLCVWMAFLRVRWQIGRQIGWGEIALWRLISASEQQKPLPSYRLNCLCGCQE